jgi:hypothetical protein
MASPQRNAGVELRVGREAKVGVTKDYKSCVAARSRKITGKEKYVGNRICKIPRSFSIVFVMP